MGSSDLQELKDKNIMFNLYNKTRHSYIYVTNNRPNGWTEWAEIFCGHSGVPGGVLEFFFFKNLFYKFFSRATLCPSASK